MQRADVQPAVTRPAAMQPAEGVNRPLGCLSAACLAVCLVAPARGDELLSYDGQTVEGAVTIADGQFRIGPHNGQTPAVDRLPLGDLQQLTFIPAPPNRETGSLLLIDNDGFHGPTEKSGKIKLRKGLHQFTLPFFQGSQGSALTLEYEGPGLKRQPVAGPVLKRWKQTADEGTPSPGFDAEGYRLPEQNPATDNIVGFKHLEWTASGAVRRIADLRNLPVKKYGTGRAINLSPASGPKNFGLVFAGYFDITRDGEYTFHLKSDDGSQLYLGKTPTVTQPSVAAPAAEEWLVTTTHEGRLEAKLQEWSDAGATFEFGFNQQRYTITVPREGLLELWTRPPEGQPKHQVDRADEPKDADTVYARNAAGQVQRVAGEVREISDGSLKILYGGQVRGISLERVVGIVMQPPAADTPAPRPPDARGLMFLVDFCGPCQIPVRLRELTKNDLSGESIWGQPLTLRRGFLYQLRLLEGRRSSLAALKPAEVRQTPFFDRIAAWTTNTSLAGKPLKVGKTSYSEGICMPARTTLTYALDGAFARFRCEVGLQDDEGTHGNATVRVLADGSPLLELPQVTAPDPPHAVDVDVSGRQRLTLEVDFGENLQIGDVVVWGNAHLLRPELTP
jgi:hypothetical protein